MISAHWIAAPLTAEGKMGSDRYLDPVIGIPPGRTVSSSSGASGKYADRPASPAFNRMEGPAHGRHHPGPAASQEMAALRADPLAQRAGQFAVFFHP
ncbi:uncharacterized protein METZ01_LOCUS422512 [marine metagenome]|uniref:Uncharacterized protein n=1 Tax=marine metagenome TaxID=408172 RepID=A0A382XH36_9ZZZZ